MGDVDRGHAQRVVELAQLELHVFAQLLVQGRQGFVHQHDPRLEHHGARQCHALALPARKLVDATRTEPGKADHVEGPLHALRGLLVAHPTQSECKRHVACHRQMRKQRVVLEHHADVALVWRRADHLSATELQAATVRPGESRQYGQQGRLAGTRWPQQCQELAAANLEVNVIERVGLAITLGQLLDRDGQRRVAGHGYSVSMFW